MVSIFSCTISSFKINSFKGVDGMGDKYYPLHSPSCSSSLGFCEYQTSIKMLWKIQSTLQRQGSIIINIAVSLKRWGQGQGWEPNSWKAGNLNTKEGNFLCSKSFWSGTFFGADLALDSLEMLKWVQESVKGVGRAFSGQRHWRNTSPRFSVSLWSNKGCDGQVGEQCGGRLYQLDSGSKSDVCWILP